MRILVVDDEPLARARLVRLIGELEAGVVVAQAGDGESALEAIVEHDVDLVLLDVRMPDVDGLEVARRLATLEQPPAVVFTTAYDSHAFAAFEARAADYLLKPIRRERLAEALARARALSPSELADQADGGDGARSYVSATLNGSIKLVPVDDIRYFRAEHKYVTVRHSGGELVIDDSLASIEQEFASRFMRVHRSTLVAAAHVRSLDKDTDGRLRVRLDGIDERIEVSRRLAGAVRRALKEARELA